MGPQRKSSPSVFIFVFTFFKVRLHKHELVYPKLKRRWEYCCRINGRYVWE